MTHQMLFRVQGSLFKVIIFGLVSVTFWFVYVMFHVCHVIPSLSCDPAFFFGRFYLAACNHCPLPPSTGLRLITLRHVILPYVLSLV